MTTEEKETRNYWAIIIAVYAAMLLTSGLLVVFGVSWGWIILLGTLGHLYASWRSVDAKEKGLVLFFGKPWLDRKSGPIIVPLGIFELRTAPRTAQEREIPDEPNKIWRKVDTEGRDLPVEPGMSPPNRVTFDDSDPDPDEDPVNKVMTGAGETKQIVPVPKENRPNDPATNRLTVEVPIMYTLQIVDFRRFMTTIGSIEEAHKRLADVIVAVAAGLLQAGTLARALANMTLISEAVTIEMRKRVAEKTQEWGIEILEVRVKPPILSHDLNTRIQQIAGATAEARAAVIKAEAERRRLELEGSGQAAARLSVMRAEAAGREALNKVTGSQAGKLNAWLETLRTAMEKSTFSIIPGSELFSAVAGIKQVLDQIQPPTKE